MNPVTKAILERLASDAFPYPVAIYHGFTPGMGPVLFADAFDVPEGPMMEVSERLNDVLDIFDSDPPLLPGAIHDFESAEKRAELPPDTV